MNKAILIGRLTKDPEMNYAAGSGTAITRFSLAIKRQFKKDETDFINCIAFGKAGETIAQYLTKGDKVAIAGSIRTGSYDAKDGSRRYTTDVIVDSFEFIRNQWPKNNSIETRNSEVFYEMTPADDGDTPF